MTTSDSLVPATSSVPSETAVAVHRGTLPSAGRSPQWYTMDAVRSAALILPGASAESDTWPSRVSPVTHGSWTASSPTTLNDMPPVAEDTATATETRMAILPMHVPCASLSNDADAVAVTDDLVGRPGKPPSGKSVSSCAADTVPLTLPLKYAKPGPLSSRDTSRSVTLTPPNFASATRAATDATSPPAGAPPQAPSENAAVAPENSTEGCWIDRLRLPCSGEVGAAAAEEAEEAVAAGAGAHG
mmetsp:Transcript_17967/g.44568  ORF Transcript_17967/g.44568 Transcript_17967/m.44568 type:complete len:244 (+) Transcript_17967:196-927(+)